MVPTRRRFMYAGTLAALGLGMGMSCTNRVQATMLGPYGAIEAADLNGVRLPAGSTARLIGVTGELVPGTSYEWHEAPDGGATFAIPGGWVYVSNSESNGNTGGVSAIRFASSGTIGDAYRILSDTKWNCAGGATPWVRGCRAKSIAAVSCGNAIPLVPARELRVQRWASSSTKRQPSILSAATSI